MGRRLNILLLEPFFSGSHKKWAEGYANSSSHAVKILSLPGRHWKWRMHGAAVTFSNQVNALESIPDLIIATDMLDVATFRGLLSQRFRGIPVATYFHENQLTYPWSPTDPDPKLKRDNHYAFINYTSSLSSDINLFNSPYHKESFLQALPSFLQGFPDHKELSTIDRIRSRSVVLPIGLDLQRYDSFASRAHGSPPLILWNHRWEYDKNPALFLELIEFMDARDLDFQLAVLGESYGKKPMEFDQLKEKFQKRIKYWGYQGSFESYAACLWEASILPVTSNQDFFGISVVEAMYCNTLPILPNRLAFPMHVPENHHSRYLYDSREELFEKVEDAINTNAKPLNDLQEHIKTYDWETISVLYDDLFSDLADRKTKTNK